MRAPDPDPKGRLVGLVGLSAATLIVATVAIWEGYSPRAYRDLAGHLTICFGDTKGVVAGQVATDAQCLERLERQLVAHAEPVLRCVPQLAGRTGELAASVSLAYNIGTNGFCGSTAARRFRAGDKAGACNAFPAWNKARIPAGQVARYRSRGESCTKGKDGAWRCTIRGLTLRRAAERTLCLQGDAA